MKNQENRLPEGATVTLLVSEDTEFLTGRLLEFSPSDAAVAVRAYDEIARDASGIAGIGYRICLSKNDPLLDRTYFFWPDDDPSLDYSDDYQEVREAMEGVLSLLRGTVQTVKVFARIGFTLEMPVKAYELMKARAESKSCPGCYGDLDLDGDEIRAFLEHGAPDGDSYIPGCVFDEVEEKIFKESDLLKHLQSQMDDFKESEKKFGFDRETKSRLDEMIACKKMVEAMIEKPVNLQKDGRVTVGF